MGTSLPSTRQNATVAAQVITVKLRCTCGKAFYREKSKVSSGRTYCCSKKCRQELTSRPDGTFRCARCLDWFDRGSFKWISDSRYAGGLRRMCYCKLCAALNLKEYRSTHREKVRRQHASWRERCLSIGGDIALKWYFRRHLGSYRQRGKRDGVPCDLATEYLVWLFHQQGGKCYYTGEVLRWDTFGSKTAYSDSMSLDRQIPEKGYVTGNVVLCTMRANVAKGGLTEESFYTFCQTVLSIRHTRSHAPSRD